MSSVLEQTAIKAPGVPKKLTIHRLGVKENPVKILDKLSGVAPRHLGVAIRVCRRSKAFSVAVAGRDAVLVVSGNTHTPGSSDVLETSLKTWLTTSSGILVAFQCERVAVLFKHATGADFRGIDLTTLKGGPKPPGAIASTALSADPFIVDALWTGNVVSKETPSDFDALCLRAWVASM